QAVVAASARNDERRFRRHEFLREPLQRRGGNATGLGRAARVTTAAEEIRDGELAPWLARDPLIRVQSGEGATRTDVDEARCVFDLRARLGEIELVWNGGAPAIEEVGAEGDDQLRAGEVPARPRRTVRATMCLDRGVVGLEVDAEVRTHSVRGEPAVEKSREAAA